ASACNVFWQVSSSATIDTGVLGFVGTVMADDSITARTGSRITGRLLARTGAVTLDTNTLVRPTSCSTTPGTVRTSPTITSPTPSAGQAGTAYSYTVTASGSPTPSFTVSSGSLPPGLTLNSATGAITGTPTTPGTYVFSITADNGTPPASTVQYSVTIAPAPVVAAVPAPPQLPATGSDPGLLPLTGALVLALGIVLTLIQRLRAASPATRR
ncbi:MAG: DUF3494 domain-containing protein, partial [Actinobacteria bacterium]|nr:DUF3494 domain-containing protein [Actinomycetota bacterium]